MLKYVLTLGNGSISLLSTKGEDITHAACQNAWYIDLRMQRTWSEKLFSYVLYNRISSRRIFNINAAHMEKPF